MQRKLLVPLVASAVALAACGSDKPVEPKPITGDPISVAVNVTCSGSTPLALAVGGVRQVSADELASLCLSSGAGSEYALIPVYTLGDPAKPVTLNVSATGTTAPTSTLSRGAPDAPRLAMAAL